MSETEAVIVDYGMGNVLSVQRGLERCGVVATLTVNPNEILSARRIILPGVGAFANAMDELQRLGLVEVIREVAQKRTPILGICLGMQLLFEVSDEFGPTSGLGLIPGKVVSVSTQCEQRNELKVPSIGWCALTQSESNRSWHNTVLEDVNPGDYVYFVHSYMAVPSDPAHRVAEYSYGDLQIPAVVVRDQITGCQFHPEKSGDIGLKILSRFFQQ